MWDKLLQLLNDNKDALGWLFGSGVVLAILGGIYRLIIWLIKEYRSRRIRTNENFPFKIISPNSNVAKEILGGEDDDPLADRNIPYQQRIQGRNTRRELEEMIEDHRWILITARTGLGKTREAIQLAQSLNNEGWTILYLTRETWLDAPAKLPSNIPERKLLFFLDDLNKKCYSSKAEVRPDASESLTLPIYEPFQIRLQRTLAAFDTFCGKSEIRVISTARNEKTSEFDEPSEWDKLGWTIYGNLWKEFKLVDLPEPDKIAEQQLLTELSEKANIFIEPDELPAVVKRNDGTFRNLVENLASSRTEGSVLSMENFRDTLKGTWQKRYQKATQKYPEAKHIYDAIELAQIIGNQLSFSIVQQVAKIVAGENFFQHIRSSGKYSLVLKQLIKIENLLHPRDGQIEGKGYRIDAEKHLPSLYKHIYLYSSKLSSDYFQQDAPSASDIISLNLIPKSIFNPSKKIHWVEKAICKAFGLTSLIDNISNAYAAVGFVSFSNFIDLKALELKTNKKSISWSWANLGLGHRVAGNYDDAIKALNKAVELYPQNYDAWSGLGVIFFDLGRYEDSIQALIKAVEINPKDSICWGNIGIFYQSQNKIDEAIDAFNRSQKLNPKYVYPIISLASYYKNIGDSLEADKLLIIVDGPVIGNEIEYFQACYQIARGNIDAGLLFLKNGLDKQQTSRAWAQKDPNFEVVRNDPRFKEIVSSG